MSYMAQWGSKGFLISPTKIAAIENFSTSVELKSDSENDTSGTSPTNTRGLEARTIEFSVTYAKATGTDPRTQLEEWESLVGQSNPLYIGGKRFGPASMILNKVDSSDFVFTANGDITSVILSLSFIEKPERKKAVVTTEKSKAMNATAAIIYKQALKKQQLKG